MKVFIAAMAHETNSFSPIPTSRANFENSLLFHPTDHPDADLERVFVGYSDFIRVARARNHQPICSLVAFCQPSAPTAQADYEEIRDRILDDLTVALPVDAVTLLLHGAQMAQGYDDCEGDILARIRALVGPDVPVGVELDLHCNITAQMMENATAIVACKEYPHTDFTECAVKLYGIIEQAVKGRSTPTMAYLPLPMLSKFHTTVEPFLSFLERVRALETEDGVLAISLAHGFPWSDMADCRAGILVVTDGDTPKAEQIAANLAPEFFSYRSEIYGNYLPIHKVLDIAEEAEIYPTVIADVTDNSGGGAASDSTFILEEMLARDMQDAALGMIWDPVMVQMASDAGEGAVLSLRIGGKLGPMSGKPLDIEATVTAVANAPYQRGLDLNVKEALGPSVALKVGGVHVILNSIRQQVFSPDCFTELGIDIGSLKTIVVKSSQHFFAQFSPVAARVLYCEAPGTLSSDLASVPYQKITRPIWPLDDVTLEGLTPISTKKH